MKKLGIIGLFLCLMLNSMPAQGQNIESLAPEKMGQLIAMRNSILTLEDNVSAGIITPSQKEQGVKRYLEQASQVLGRTLSQKELFSVQASDVAAPAIKLTPLQKFSGLITVVNVLWVIAIFVGVLCGIYLFGDFLVNIMRGVPVEVYEGLLYIFSIGLAMYGRLLEPGIGPYVGLTACLLFAGGLSITMIAHKLNNFMVQFWAILFVTWSAVAIVYQSQMIGFIAVGALMALLGFSVIVMPFVVVLGFEDEDSLGKATAAAFAILLLYTASIVFNFQMSWAKVFQNGALFLGSFVGFLGLDIASTRWYGRRNRNYALFQLIAILAGIFAIYVGSVYGIGELQKIGGTFFVLFLLTKLSEIPVESRRGYAVLGLFSSALIYGFCVYVKSHPGVFGPYLFLVS